MMILCCCIFSWSQGQDCSATLSGKVLDFHDGSPIINATIFIESLNKYTTTDVNGQFSVTALCNAPIVIVVSHLACETKTVPVTIEGNTFVDINLEHHIEELNEVQVAGVSSSKLTKTKK